MSQDIIENARVLQTSEDEIVVLERDLKACNLTLDQHSQVIVQVQEIMEKVERLNRPDLSLETAYDVLANLKVNFCTYFIAISKNL